MDKEFFPVSRCVDNGQWNFYYPFGNTSAEDFLENVDPGLVKKPDILVLGCGDIRSCFYTLWKHFVLNGELKSNPIFSGVNFVLNDCSAAVLARNILFLYLCTQKPTNIPSEDFKKWFCTFWAIWFSQKLLPDHNQVLNAVLGNLLRYSADLSTWTSQGNPLNTLVQFTSQQTLDKIHKVWEMWATNSPHLFKSEKHHVMLSTSENTDIENLLGMAISSGIPSCEIKRMEFEISACEDGNSFAEYVVCKDFVLPIKKLVANVTMVERADGKYVMHSLLPFRCFHHAFQFSPSQLRSLAGVDGVFVNKLLVADERFKEYPLLANSVQQLALWLSCTPIFTRLQFQTNSQAMENDVSFTFHCSDAIAFCNEVQGNPSRYQLGADKFDMIYTSNLIDPINPPHLVLFSVPLLKPSGYLFTTTIKYKCVCETTQEYLEKSFGINNKMLPVLFGIRCFNHEGSFYRSTIAVRPAPVEAYAVSPNFTPYYVKPLIWETVPPMMSQNIQPDSLLWHELYNCISTILSVHLDALQLSTSQTAVKVLQTFQTHVSADDSDGHFWDPLCSLLKNDGRNIVKHLLSAFQTHAMLSGLHLHLLVTDKTCPLCNKIKMSDFFGEICVTMPMTSLNMNTHTVNVYARIHKSQNDLEGSLFDCLALQNEPQALALRFTVPLDLIDSRSNVSIVSFPVNEPFIPLSVLVTKPIKSCLVNSKDRYLYMFSVLNLKVQTTSSTFGVLKSHLGNGDTFESVISLSDHAYSTYSKCKKISPTRLSPSKIQISCGLHVFELAYPHPVNFNSLSIKICRASKTVTILAMRMRHEFHGESGSLFRTNPSNMLALPRLQLHEVVMRALLGMQYSDNEAAQLRLSPTTCKPLTILKNLINIMMQEKDVYFTFMDPENSLCGMVMVINRLFDYQLKAPAIDLMYFVSPESAVKRKWYKFSLCPSEYHQVDVKVIQLMHATCQYFSLRTSCSAEVKALSELKKHVDHGFKRAIVYPLYGDADVIVSNQSRSLHQIKADPLFNDGNENIEKYCCDSCGNLAVDQFKCKSCFKVQFCGRCKEHHLTKHELLCQNDVSVKQSKTEGLSKYDATSRCGSSLPERKACSYCSTPSDQLKKCSRCNLVQYCNQACQRKHWEEHKKQCRPAELKSEVASSFVATKSKNESTTIMVSGQCTYCLKSSSMLEQCSKCHEVQYCAENEECQIKHQIEHQKTNKENLDEPSHTLTGDSSKRCSYCFKISSELKKCTMCHAVQYCDKECQKKHWKDHKIRCKSGRVFAKCDIYTSANDFCTKRFEPKDKCDYCALPAKDLKQCTRCRKAQYCNKVCQTRHWNEHKQFCKADPSIETM